MQLPPLPELPGVSYVMPVLNEVDHLERAVRSILNQDYAGPKEIVLAVAPCTDGTEKIAVDLASHDDRVRVVWNEARDIPIGLNLAIEASSHPVIIRVDAHSDLTPDYTSTGVTILRNQFLANVGGVMRAEGTTTVQRAIASAYNSPLGLGGGAYHGDGTPREAESAYLGIFRREAIAKVGGYDPKIRRGEDWELNLRIRMAGGKIWFDPSLGVTYWPRASFSDLARQFYATGAWRAVLVRKYPAAHPWRFFAPGFLVLGLTFSLLLGIAILVNLAPENFWILACTVPGVYAVGILLGACTLPGLHGIRERITGARALITMHILWGTGFVKGLLFGAIRVIDRSRAK